ncbi:MAG: hypothetical protein U0586_11740 [Candidatus Brocadiaceae bacterium]
MAESLVGLKLLFMHIRREDLFHGNLGLFLKNIGEDEGKIIVIFLTVYIHYFQTVSFKADCIPLMLATESL